MTDTLCLCSREGHRAVAHVLMSRCRSTAAKQRRSRDISRCLSHIPTLTVSERSAVFSRQSWDIEPVSRTLRASIEQHRSVAEVRSTLRFCTLAREGGFVNRANSCAVAGSIHAAK